MLLQINSPKDLRLLSKNQLPVLAQEMRSFIWDTLSIKAGHLGASLGVVELTIALHYCFDTPNDLLVWDVGHQAYGHKLLTGRRADFANLRQLNGMAGFPNREESIFDAFGTGHSSTAISAIMGMAKASKLNNNDIKKHIAVIGDSSIASGMAFEALNHLGVTDLDVLIILNDNGIGIDAAVGALSNHFLMLKNNYTKNNFFTNLGIHYLGVIDGHNLEVLCEVLEKSKTIKGPKVLHCITTKGKGFAQSEGDQVLWHAPGFFDKDTGVIHAKKNKEQATFQQVFGETMTELAQINSKIIAITPAMTSGSALTGMANQYPDRVIDVGIAEQHAVTFAAGLATQGMVPFCVVYSTFLQRAYDQIIHDVALQNLPVVFCIDRAGIVGEDGATHHGSFDIAYLNCLPNLTIAVPSNEIELRNLLYTAQKGLAGPIAIRYPRGGGSEKKWQLPFEVLSIGKGKTITNGRRVAVLFVGVLGNTVQAIYNKMALTDQQEIGIYNMMFVKPIDESLLNEVLKKYQTIITLEDGVISGGFGQTITNLATANNYKGHIINLGYPDHFIAHGSTQELYETIGLNEVSLHKTIKQTLN